ncbi:diacylglycerol/lipid kinase family protein [Nitrosovibrio sp. Nv4]|uniref:diacylglycerol/lipid kinase family protein n=1 Tax=Nitrosovibrio sp. Nv4 TaxID=1945880 RepID=UPI000BCD6AE1|nr:diacylglycerol kinase family protein [Nitrosovibrio sp. Nv4]SOD40625.1 Diacylglycerol kinase catalytic domain-containing protein [Nitrosovibrio sp. Nv4]
MIEQFRIDRLRTGSATVGFLFNPLSGRIRKRRDAIRREMGGIHDAVCRDATSGPEIRASVDAFVEADTDLLVIVGGDGTVQAVLNHLFTIQPPAKWPILSVIPGGTTNMTALDLGIHGRPEDNLRKLSKCLLNRNLPPLLQRHVLCIEQAGTAKVYGMFFGIGLIARAVIFSQGRIKQLGVTGEIYSAIIMLGYLAGALIGRRQGPWAPVQLAVIEQNIELHRGTYTFLFASTLDRLLFGMRPYWGQEQEPLHVTFVRQQRKRPLRSLLQLLSGHGSALKEQNGYFSSNTSVLELMIDDDYIVDGESYRAASQGGPLRISAAGPISFLVANSANANL